MTQPTRKEIIDAHDALTSLLKIASRTSTASAIINEKVVRAALPPKPRPTMADVEWDDDKHYLAEARQTFCGKVIMLGKDDDGFIKFLVPNFYESGLDVAPPISFTLTGKRYTLTEVQE